MNEHANEIKVLDELNKGASMGMDAIYYILDKVSDTALKDELNNEYERYKDIKEKIRKIYSKYTREQSPETPSVFSKTMIWYGVEMKTLINESSSKIAEILLQGTNMGIIEGRKLLNNNKTNEDVHKLVKEFVDMQEQAVEQLKMFL